MANGKPMGRGAHLQRCMGRKCTGSLFRLNNVKDGNKCLPGCLHVFVIYFLCLSSLALLEACDFGSIIRQRSAQSPLISHLTSTTVGGVSAPKGLLLSPQQGYSSFRGANYLQRPLARSRALRVETLRRRRSRGERAGGYTQAAVRPYHP